MYLHLGGIIVNGFSWFSSKNALQSILFFASAIVSADVVNHGNQRQEHRNHNAADNHGQKNNHDGFEQGSHGGHGVVHFFVVVVGDLQKHFRHGTGLFAHVHHADDHRRKNAGGFERRGDGFAFLDAFVDFDNGVADDDIAGGFLHNRKRLQNGDAAADERAERSRETRDGDFADDRAERGHLEFEFIP